MSGLSTVSNALFVSGGVHAKMDLCAIFKSGEIIRLLQIMIFMISS